MKELRPRGLLEHALPFLENAGLTPPLDAYAEAAINSVRDKAKTLQELVIRSDFYFRELPDYDEHSIAKFHTPEHLAMLKELSAVLMATDPFEKEPLKATVDKFLEDKGLKLKAVAQPLRVALTGTTISPGIYETLELLGKDRVKKRLEHVIIPQ